MLDKKSFYTAITHIFEGWTALQLAVENGFGGQYSREKAVWMVSATVQWFGENKNIEAYELSEFLGSIMNNEFDTIPDDGSLLLIAKEVCGCFRLCDGLHEAELNEKISQYTKANTKNCQQGSDQEQDMDSDDDEVEAPPLLPPRQGGGVTEQMEGLTITEEPEPTAEDIERQQAIDDGWTFVEKGKKRR